MHIKILTFLMLACPATLSPSARSCILALMWLQSCHHHQSLAEGNKMLMVMVSLFLTLG